MPYVSSWHPLGGYPKVDWGPKSATAKLRGLIDPAEAVLLVSLCFPATTSVVATYTQIAYPDPALEFLRATRLHFEPASNRARDTAPKVVNGIVQHSRLVVDIDYATLETPQGDDKDPKDDNDPVPRLTHEWDVSGEFANIPGAMLQWKAGHEPVTDDVEFAKLVTYIGHRISWPNVVNPPFTGIRECIGRINQQAMNFATGEIKVGTLLFDGAMVRRTVRTDGSRSWDMSYHFTERIIPADDGADHGTWNHQWRSGEEKSGWWEIERVTGADHETDVQPLYESVDMTPKLFPQS